MRERGRMPTDPARIRAIVGALDATDLTRAVAQLRHPVVELVLVGQVVDQPEAQRVLGQERALVDERAHVGLGSSSASRRSRATNCSYMSRLSDSLISRCAGVKPFSVS